MKKQSHTVPRRRQSASPASRHLPLVDILIDDRPSCRSWSSRLAYGCSRRCSKKIGLPCVAPGMRISRPGTRIAPAMLRAKSSWAGIKSRSVGPECGATAWRCRCPRPRRSRTRTR